MLEASIGPLLLLQINTVW